MSQSDDMTALTTTDKPANEENSKRSDFSIDHILNRAGNSNKKSVDSERSDNLKFQWLQCSRYCPPRIPRLPKKDIQKRQLGRHPRIPFTSFQLSVMEQKFKETPYLSTEEVNALSKKLQLADMRVKIWFQNRRARERREKSNVDVTKPREEGSCEENRLGTRSPDEEDQEMKNPTRNRITDYSQLDFSSSSKSLHNNVNKVPQVNAFLMSNAVPLLFPYVHFVNSDNTEGESYAGSFLFNQKPFTHSENSKYS